MIGNQNKSYFESYILTFKLKLKINVHNFIDCVKCCK